MQQQPCRAFADLVARQAHSGTVKRKLLLRSRRPLVRPGFCSSCTIADRDWLVVGRDLGCVVGAARSFQVDIKQPVTRNGAAGKRLTFRQPANLMSPIEKSKLASFERGDHVYEQVCLSRRAAWLGIDLTLAIDGAKGRDSRMAPRYCPSAGRRESQSNESGVLVL